MDEKTGKGWVPVNSLSKHVENGEIVEWIQKERGFHGKTTKYRAIVDTSKTMKEKSNWSGEMVTFYKISKI